MMSTRVLHLRFLCSLIVILASLTPRVVWGNDAAAEVAAGGIQLRDERRVSLLRERLHIAQLPGEKDSFRITVEYEFLNETGSDVVTRVAFPIPEYGYEFERAPRDFKDFRVWADGVSVPYQEDVGARYQGKDVTALLQDMGIDVESFGHFAAEGEPFSPRYQIAALPSSSLEKLIRLGLVDPDRYHWPRWQVVMTYHWTQRFPAKTVVRIRHEYTPVYGFASERINALASERQDGCFDEQTVQRIGAAKEMAARKEKEQVRDFVRDYVPLRWVRYILTTANTWKMPIREFELAVERPEGTQVSFCWNGKVEKIGKTRFRARAKNFIPQRELTIYFYSTK